MVGSSKTVRIEELGGNGDFSETPIWWAFQTSG